MTAIDLPPDLVYLTDETLGIRRRKYGRGFSYLNPKGELIRDESELSRIKMLAVPPAWSEVWISPLPNGHLQATGRDEKQRKQYRYHELWTSFAQRQKFHHLWEFGQLLPRIRAVCESDLRRPTWDFQKVAALAVSVMDSLHLRVGSRFYSKTNHTYGLTTLRRKHIHLCENELELSFTGKTGKERKLILDDKRLVRLIKECSDLPGYEIFRYRDKDVRKPLRSQDFNEYLREISKNDEVSAKDFRTWGANVLCLQKADEAFELSKTSRKKIENILAGLVAKEMGHTLSICKSSYLHPKVLEYALNKKPGTTKVEENDFDVFEDELLMILQSQSQ